jgi:hypothetical protein
MAHMVIMPTGLLACSDGNVQVGARAMLSDGNQFDFDFVFAANAEPASIVAGFETAALAKAATEGYVVGPTDTKTLIGTVIAL